MIGPVGIRIYRPPEYDRREIFRYAGVPTPGADMEQLLDSCLRDVDGRLTWRVCYREFPATLRGDTLDLTFWKTTSVDLRKNLAGCDSVVLFAATVGVELDRLIARFSRVSPAKALMLQAIGSERIEALCDLFDREIRAEKQALGQNTRPRFSPGYGDVPLEAQRAIFSVLDCSKTIGLTLNESLLMSPSKSVTALIGVGSCGEGEHLGHGCGHCGKKDCQFRRTL